ncbi:MAG: beta-xylosidase [Lachnospiraceae bacterium]
MTTYTFDLERAGEAFPHYWELCVGSCHAAMLLRADLQEQIRQAHRDIGFQYIRFHGLFDDDMSVVIEPMIPGMGEEQISFFNIDRIFDFLVGIGMKPFVEIGFMPEAYRSSDAVGFHYKNNVSMPADDAKWKKLIDLFARHLEERYGAEEVRTWYFEVWNEPNLRFFFDGTMEDYWHLYEMTARSLKMVDEKLRVGGPATSTNGWIPEFRAFCRERGVPCDFITTHQYPSDDPLSKMGMNGPGKKGEMFTREQMEQLRAMPKEELGKLLSQFLNRENNNPRDILQQMAKKAREEAGNLPLIYTEWNVGHFDTSYAAAGILMTLQSLQGLVQGYSYWCISDLFEENGLHGIPFNNEFGLVNVYGIPKPAYRVFEALHRAGNVRLPADQVSSPARTAEVLALKKEEETTFFVWNHDIEARDVKAEEICLELSGQIGEVSAAAIDAAHTNPLRCWEEMGKPLYPDAEQLLEIREASRLLFSPVTEKSLENDPLPVRMIGQEHGHCSIVIESEPESAFVLRVRTKRNA